MTIEHQPVQLGEALAVVVGRVKWIMATRAAISQLRHMPPASTQPAALEESETSGVQCRPERIKGDEDRSPRQVALVGGGADQRVKKV